MKKIAFLVLSGFVSSSLFAQELTSKIVVAKGDHIKVTSDMNSNNTMSMGGEPMESKTVANSYYDLEVKEIKDSVITISQTLKKMKLDFDGFGQKMKYDSESKEKQDNQFIKNLSEKVEVPEEYKISLSGKLIEEEEKAGDKKNDTKKGGGMMRMMAMGGGSVVESAFLIIPQDAVAKGGWETSTTKDDLTIRRKYTIAAMMGPLATINVQSQTKGDVSMNRGGMSVVTKVNTLTEEMIVVNVVTGKVTMQTINMTNNSKTIMDDKESPSTGKTTINYTFE